jgi:hypothetical protein
MPLLRHRSIRAVLAVLAGLLLLQAAFAATHGYAGDCDSGVCFSSCDLEGPSATPVPSTPPGVARHPARPMRVARTDGAAAAHAGDELPVAGPPPRILFQSFLL